MTVSSGMAVRDPGSTAGRRPVLLLLAFAAALAARLGMVFFSPWQTGMSLEYLGGAYMMAADYGYSRTEISRWSEVKRDLSDYSKALSEKGRQIDRGNRPEIETEALIPQQWRLPGYSVFLLAVYRVFGEPLERWAGIVGAVIGAFTPLLIYALTVAMFRRPGAALGAAWIAALYPPLAITSAMLLPVGLWITILLVALLCVVQGAKSEGRTAYLWFLLGGLVIGLSCYFRSNGFYLWLFFGAALFMVMAGFVRPLVSTAVLALGVFAALAPWAIRNYDTSGVLLWGSTGTGSTIWKSIGEYQNPWGVKNFDPVATKLAKENGFESDGTIEADRWFKDKVKQYAREDPMFFVKAAAKRLVWQIAPPFETGYVNPHRTKGMFSHFRNEEGLSPVQVLIRHPGYVVRAYWERILVMIVSALGTLSILALYFVKSGNRDHIRQAIILSVIPVYFIAIHALIVNHPRYLTPIIPLQIIALTVFLSILWQRYSHRLFRRTDSP
ncbi:MAG: hypothetical protein MJE12_16750 [Alphaproteobacteria bacterium]|nr:hypothetical protein [Alphaproteobacteria bacterium]